MLFVDKQRSFPSSKDTGQEEIVGVKQKIEFFKKYKKYHGSSRLF